MLKFDTQILRSSLEKLSNQQRTAFAAFCAIRQFRFLLELSKKRSEPNLEKTFYDGLDFVAKSLSAAQVHKGDLAGRVQKCTKYAPTEDEALRDGVPYSADASRQVIFVLQQLGAEKNDINPAFFAAQIGYEIASDQEQKNLSDGVITAQDDINILLSRIVQDELQEQDSDLAAVRSEKSDLGSLVRSRIHIYP